MTAATPRGLLAPRWYALTVIAIDDLARRHPLLVALLAATVLLGAALVGSTHGVERCLQALVAACLMAELAMMPLLVRIRGLVSRRSCVPVLLLRCARAGQKSPQLMALAPWPLPSLVRLQV
jgi:hypothetical protein